MAKKTDTPMSPRVSPMTARDGLVAAGERIAVREQHRHRGSEPQHVEDVVARAAAVAEARSHGATP